jgi:hypothetical protein
MCAAHFALLLIGTKVPGERAKFAANPRATQPAGANVRP